MLNDMNFLKKNNLNKLFQKLELVWPTFIDNFTKIGDLLKSFQFYLITTWTSQTFLTIWIKFYVALIMWLLLSCEPIDAIK